MAKKRRLCYCFRRAKYRVNIVAGILIRITGKQGFVILQNNRLNKGQFKGYLKKRDFQTAEVISCGFFSFVFLGLLYFFYEIALTITMQPGLVAVFAKGGGDILLIQLKAREDEEPREMHRHE